MRGQWSNDYGMHDYECTPPPTNEYVHELGRGWEHGSSSIIISGIIISGTFLIGHAPLATPCFLYLGGYRTISLFLGRFLYCGRDGDEFLSPVFLLFVKKSWAFFSFNICFLSCGPVPYATSQRSQR
ncbi:unnamed protein product [Ectocarpus sp. 4 AP-2014]